MTQSVQDILRKINYIEADMEIQRQILFSTPSDNKNEMEKVLKIMADLKNQVETLRAKIKKLDPEAHSHILRLEAATAEFKKLATANQFKSVKTWQPNEPCSTTLKSGETLECLVKAENENGDTIIITFDGTTKTFSKTEIAD